MKTVLLDDVIYGTKIVFNGRDEVTVTVATVPFSKLTMPLDLDDVDRLLALREHSVTPVADLSEHFRFVYHCPERSAKRAAEAFIVAAPGLAETLR